MGAMVLAVVLALLAGAAVGLWLARRGGGLGGAVLERRLESISQDLDRRLAALDQRLWLGLDTVQHAQAQAAESAAEVRERVAVVGGIAQQVLEQARDLARLEELLRPPQARGAFGELLLEELLAQGLPGACYRTQHQFRSGARVDAVLQLGDALVPVDSKFPLDSFARLAACADGDDARAAHRRAFIKDARRHVDAIADKYIRPDEGTLDFALCYLPSEAVYHEFLREDPPGESPFRYAVSRRVFPVSPGSLYAYLLSIGVGLRGLRVEANARRVVDALATLQGALGGFSEDFEVVGKHLNNARARWEEAARRLDRFAGLLSQVTDHADDLDEAVYGNLLNQASDSAAPDTSSSRATAATTTVTS